MALRRALFSQSLLVSLLFFCTYIARAEELSIQTLGLMKNTAIVKINGTQRILKVGKATPEGVTLKSATSKSAVIVFQGKEQTLTMDNTAPMSIVKSEDVVKTTVGKEVRLQRQPDNMFRTSGLVNGMPVNFLVDTGATTIAMNHKTAQRLGIPFRVKGEPIQVTTASGVEKGYRVILDRVRIGNISLNQIEAVILVGEHPEVALLGNSFLSKLIIQQDGNVLVLKSRF